MVASARACKHVSLPLGAATPRVGCVRGGSAGALESPRERTHGGMLEELDEGQITLQDFAQLLMQLDDQERRAPCVEEVVVEADVIDSEQTLPGGRNRLFRAGLWRCGVGLKRRDSNRCARARLRRCGEQLLEGADGTIGRAADLLDELRQIGAPARDRG